MPSSGRPRGRCGSQVCWLLSGLSFLALVYSPSGYFFITCSVFLPFFLSFSSFIYYSCRLPFIRIVTPVLSVFVLTIYFFYYIPFFSPFSFPSSVSYSCGLPFIHIVTHPSCVRPQVTFFIVVFSFSSCSDFLPFLHFLFFSLLSGSSLMSSLLSSLFFYRYLLVFLLFRLLSLPSFPIPFSAPWTVTLLSSLVSSLGRLFFPSPRFPPVLSSVLHFLFFFSSSLHGLPLVAMQFSSLVFFIIICSISVASFFFLPGSLKGICR